MRGEPMDWGAVFEGYRSQMDWPGARYWRELVAAFPVAKVVLTVRPAEDWYRSFAATVARELRKPPIFGRPDRHCPSRAAARDDRLAGIPGPLRRRRARDRPVRGAGRGGPARGRAGAAARLRRNGGVGTALSLPRRAGAGPAVPADEQRCGVPRRDGDPLGSDRADQRLLEHRDHLGEVGAALETDRVGKARKLGDLGTTAERNSVLAVEMRHLLLGVARCRPRRPWASPPRSRRGRAAPSRASRAPSASASRSRRRAPTSGTMSVPCAATQAIAACATRHAAGLGHRAQRLDKRQVGFHVRALEARDVGAEVAGAGVARCQWPLIRPRDSTP